MMRATLAALLLTGPFTAPDLDEEVCTRGVHAFIALKDYRLAVKQAKEALALYPHSASLQRSLIEAWALFGDEKEMLAAWKAYAPFCNNEAEAHALFETMAWGVLKKGGDSRTLTARIFTLIGSVLTRDSNAVAVLQHSLRDSNSLLRAVAAQLTPFMRDAPLQEELMRLLNEESVYGVRLVAIEAAGRVRLTPAVGLLKGFLANERLTYEEKSAAARALASIIEDVTPEEIALLVKSDRFGLRLLACQFLTVFDRVEDLELLRPLLSDSRAEVRLAAISAYAVQGDINSAAVTALFQEALSDPDPLVGITAAWALLPSQDLLAGQFLMEKLDHSIEEVRCFAAAALAAGGSAGQKALKEAFAMSRDPYVKANLACGMIALRDSTDEACRAIETLLREKGMLMWKKRGVFDAVCSSTLRHIEPIPCYPESMDQIVRLQLLHLMIVVEHPQARTALRAMMSERSFGVSGMAAALMLQEGDASDAELTRELLQDPDDKVRLQAALILAVWVGDSAAIDTLQTAFFEVDSETKLKILEALGHIGDKRSIPFLLERLQEPFQTQRIVAASSLIRCLND